MKKIPLDSNQKRIISLSDVYFGTEPGTFMEGNDARISGLSSLLSGSGVVQRGPSGVYISPALANGTTAVTQAPGTNNSTVATTAFVTAAITAAGTFSAVLTAGNNAGGLTATNFQGTYNTVGTRELYGYTNASAADEAYFYGINNANGDYFIVGGDTVIANTPFAYLSVGDGTSVTGIQAEITRARIGGTSASFIGAAYDADYSANYTSRSLIDKGYLTSVLASYPTGSGAANRVAYWSGASTLTSSASLQFNGTTLSVGGTDSMTVNGASITTHLATHAADGLTEVNVEFHKHGATAASGAIVYFARSRGSAGAETIVSNGDTLGYIGIAGYDGTDYALGGYLKWTTDAAPGSNDMPTALAIGLSPDGTQTPVDVLTISSAGVFTMTGSLSVSTTINATTGYKVNSAAASGTFLRGDGTNYVSSTLTIPNTATVNRVVYATGANAWGDSANLTFDGNSLTVGTSVISPIIQGSTAVSGSLTLRATSNATDGAIIFQSDSTTERARILSTGEMLINQTSLYSSELVGIQKNQNAATYADITGASISLAAGTWLIIGQVNARAVNAIFQAFVAITDGANAVISEVPQSRPASGTASLNSPMSMTVTALVSPAGTTTYKLRGARGLTTHTGSWIAMDGNGVNTANHASNNSDKGTGIFAIRIV